jgi:hypothetical protein
VEHLIEPLSVGMLQLAEKAMALVLDKLFKDSLIFVCKVRATSSGAPYRAPYRLC